MLKKKRYRSGIGKKLQDYITRNFYHCTDEILAGLGEMYVCDERFKKNIDKHAVGTSEFISKAIKIYCKLLLECNQKILIALSFSLKSHLLCAIIILNISQVTYLIRIQLLRLNSLVLTRNLFPKYCIN